LDLFDGSLQLRVLRHLIVAVRVMRGYGQAQKQNERSDVNKAKTNWHVYASSGLLRIHFRIGGSRLE
jgi:hypothetical protein